MVVSIFHEMLKLGINLLSTFRIYCFNLSPPASHIISTRGNFNFKESNFCLFAFRLS